MAEDKKLTELNRKRTLGESDKTYLVSDGVSYYMTGGDLKSEITKDGVAWGTISGNIDSQTDLKDKFDDVGEDIGDVVSGLATANQRIDTILANPGSTSGDLELLDTHIGVHGQTYGSAGDAIRANAEQLYDMKTGFDGVVYQSPGAAVRGEDQKIFDTAVTSNGVNGYDGKFISDADAAEPNSLYYLSKGTAADYPTNIPVIINGWLLTTESETKNNHVSLTRQYVFDEMMNILYWRSKGTGSWSSWAIPKDYPIKNMEGLGYAGVVLSDANDAAPNSVYRILANIDTYYPANMPVKKLGFLVTLRTQSWVTSQVFWMQFFMSENGTVSYTRTKTEISGSGSWGAWTHNIANADYVYQVLNGFYKVPQNNLIDFTRIVKGKYVDANSGSIGTATNFAYMETPVTAGDVYRVAYSYGTCHVAFFSANAISVANYVSGVVLKGDFTIPSGVTYMAVSFDYIHGPAAWCNQKSLFSSQGMRRQFMNNEVKVAKDGTGDFDKITDALAYALDNPGTTIYVDKGTYDLIDELGAQYFEDFEYVAYTNMGPQIGYGTHLICSPKAKVTCHYTGNNEDVMTGFSPFNPVATNTDGAGDYIIENLVVEASNVRYCVHDDVGTQRVPYTHEYRRCQMSLDNSERPSGGHTHRCIGGGLGVQGIIVVEDCYFDGAGDTDDVALAFHNDNYSGDPQSSITFNRNYFYGTNTIEIASIGNQTVKTKCMITGNSLGSDIVYRRIGSVDNMEIVAWNNEVRTS